jgi:hypothetical protein
MIRYLKQSQVDFDVPAPVAACGVLLAAALTKGGHSEWAVGGLLGLYVLHLAIPILRRDPSDDRPHYHT